MIIELAGPDTTKCETSGEITKKVLLRGDLGALSNDEKLEYAQAICRRFGLDPTLQPFRVLKIQDREVLYCTKAGAEQLSQLHAVSHEILEREERREIYTVFSRAQLPGGRHNDSTGSVSLAGLKGEARANAMMTAETKSKRRATLSLLGLGILCEEEISSIPGAALAKTVLKEPSGENPQAELDDPGETPFPFGTFRGRPLREVVLKKGTRKISSAIDWCTRQGQYLDFTLKARSYLETIQKDATQGAAEAATIDPNPARADMNSEYLPAGGTPQRVSEGATHAL